MPRQRMDYEKVANAAEKLINSGKDPSLVNVCKELGVSSKTRELSKLFEKWHQTQPAYQNPIDIKLQTRGIIEKNVELEKSLSLLRAILESTADGIMMVNGKGQVVDWNQKFVEMWRIPSHMLESGKESIGFEYILEQLSNPESVVADVQYLYEHPEWQGNLPLLHFKDGRIFERFTQPQRVGAEIVGRVYSFRDVTQRLMSEDEIRIRGRAIEASIHGIAIIDVAQGKQSIIYVNASFEQITGYSKKQAIGKELVQILGAKADHVNQKRIGLAINEQYEEHVELECFRRAGEIYWCDLSVAPVSDSFNIVKHYVCIINDITRRREMEKQLVNQATHDSLTALPNRILFVDRVEQAILLASKKSASLALLFLDLDRFKMTNDTLGHSIGDKLLQAVANRLLAATNDFDTVARLGGDEFVILLTDIADEKEAEEIAQKILDLLEKPFRVHQYNLKITGSIGISFYPKDGLDYESLMKNADLSMYYAKDSGRNRCRIFEHAMKMQALNRMQLDNALHDAMKNKEFYLVYQPLIDLKTELVVGMEALIRWNSAILGKVSPMEFIGVAEENGLIFDIGTWVLEEACRQTISWHEAGYSHLRIAVNVSGRQFHQGNLADAIAAILQKTGLPAKFLELELTESLLVEDINHSIKTMNQLKNMGIHLVIDDFGTGYSSLSYLKQFPVDKLKIDASFISELVDKESDVSIVRAIINLGHTLKLDVLAEGIETELQREFILSYDCDYAQGYYFKPPETSDLLKDYLENNQRK